MDYKGVIIEESLEDKSILKDVKVLETKVEEVTEEHKTPWIKQWTLHTVEVLESRADIIVQKISKALDSEHNWYADFKNDSHHYIIFRNKVFFVDRYNKEQYDEAKKYGISLGIPEYQVDFHPEVREWQREKLSTTINYEEFKKVELKVGQVVAAERVIGSEKLLKLTVELGEAVPRQIVSGIAKAYEPEALLGRQIVIVANLEPRQIMGLESQGMILAADSGEGPVLLLPEKPVLPGTLLK